jgi:FMN phosphatase YigB (HAD superfamily)
MMIASMAETRQRLVRPVSSSLEGAGIRVILFDIGGVLLRWQDEWLFRRVAEELGAPVEDVGRAILAYRPLLQSGRISLRAFWSRVSRRCHRPLPHRWRSLWLEDLGRLGREDASVLRVAHALQRKGRRVGVFSNTDASHVRLFRSRGWFLGLSPRFYSFELGAVKPQATAFRRVRARLGVPAGAILLIDDKAENVAMARKSGWKAVQFEGNRKLERSLEALGL